MLKKPFFSLNKPSDVAFQGGGLGSEGFGGEESPARLHFGEKELLFRVGEVMK